MDVLSVSIAGMLGRVRIFVRDRPWEANKPEGRTSQHWWAHRESLSTIGWELIADRSCRPSWDKPLEVSITIRTSTSRSHLTSLCTCCRLNFANHSSYIPINEELSIVIVVFRMI